MLPEIGASELIVIAIVALIVVGPKDLPLMLRKLGQFMAKLRGMAAEFRASFDEMARQSELDELRKEVEAMRRGQVADFAAQDAHNAQVQQVFNEIEDSLQQGSMQMHPPMSYQYDTPAEPVAPAPEPTPAPKVTKAQAKPAAAKAPAAKPAAKKAAAPKKAAAAKAPATKTAAAKPRATKNAGTKA